MKHITTDMAREKFDNILDDVTRYNEPVAIVSDGNVAAVLLSIEEWNGIQETTYLQAIPGMAESIKAAASEPLEDGIDAMGVNYDV